MKYLVSVLHDSPELAPDDEMAAIDVFNDKLVANGHFVLAGGLTAPSTASVIDNRRDAGVVTDGPYLESKEFVAGFWVWEVPDHETALALAVEGSKACNRRLEVRAFLELPS